MASLVKRNIKIRCNLAVGVTAEKHLRAEATAELRKAAEESSDAFH